MEGYGRITFADTRGRMSNEVCSGALKFSDLEVSFSKLGMTYVIVKRNEILLMRAIRMVGK